MLDKVEVGGSDWTQRHTEIPHDGHRLQKDFRQQHGGAPVQIYATRMHLFHQAAKKAEIVMRGGSERGSVSRGMHVRDVRADREMNRYRDAKLVGVRQPAGLRGSPV